MPFALVLIAAVALGTTLLEPGTSATAAPIRPVRVVHTYPHDRASFCQGLVVHQQALLEGTGQLKHSRLRLVDIESGQPRVDIALPGNVFGEGVTVWQNTVVQLTWQNGYLITYDATTFRRTGTVLLRHIDPGLKEGWGITHDGKYLIISDGSATLRFVNPSTFRTVRRIRVRDGRSSLNDLNELEYVNGEIFANVWYRDQIARIDPETGRVNSWLELKPLRPPGAGREAVLNGIAWDAVNKRLFVTGKNWPTVYEIEF